MVEGIEKFITGAVGSAKNKELTVNEFRDVLHKISPQNGSPVDFVRWVPIENVRANNYNPNSVARVELQLLQVSIMADGYTQPIVTIWDDETLSYVIVDGFHRYTCMKLNKEIYDAHNGHLPIVVIQKDKADRMASTIRHNRARGKHSTEGNRNVVLSMAKEGKTTEEICHDLGMELEEVVLYKKTSGFSKLFKNVEYSRAWETSKQAKIRRDHNNEKDK